MTFYEKLAVAGKCFETHFQIENMISRNLILKKIKRQSEHANIMKKSRIHAYLH